MESCSSNEEMIWGKACSTWLSAFCLILKCSTAVFSTKLLASVPPEVNIISTTKSMHINVQSHAFHTHIITIIIYTTQKIHKMLQKTLKDECLLICIPGSVSNMKYYQLLPVWINSPISWAYNRRWFFSRLIKIIHHRPKGPFAQQRASTINVHHLLNDHKNQTAKVQQWQAGPVNSWIHNHNVHAHEKLKLIWWTTFKTSEIRHL